MNFSSHELFITRTFNHIDTSTHNTAANLSTRALWRFYLFGLCLLKVLIIFLCKILSNSDEVE